MHGFALLRRRKFIALPYSFIFYSSSASAYRHTLRNYDLTTCIATLQSCAQQQDLGKGRETHCYMLRNGLLDSPSSITSLINMYSKCNRIGYAFGIFNTASPDRNVFAYNATIASLVAHGQAEKGIELYREMREIGIIPDRFTFPCVIKGLSDLMNASEVKKAHGLVFKLELTLDVFVGSALINCYLKFGLMQEAEMLFDRLSTRDVVLWNSMVNGYAQTGQLDKALEVFREMCEVGVVPSRFTVTGVLSVFSEMDDLESGRAIHGFVVKIGYGSSVPICNALIDMYSKCKSMEDAFEIFATTEGKDLYSWNSIISAHESSGDYDATLRLFGKMLSRRVRPDLVTVTTVLPACSNLAALSHGKAIHSHILVSGNRYDTNDVLLNNAIMDMYVKCGSMRDALSVFENMRNKDVASWNIMIMGYAVHGYGNAALDFFRQMRDRRFRPDMVTFIGVLSACSHSGFLRQGREFLAQMESLYGVVPTVEHYTCIVDMLGRANQLKEAYEIARSMPFESNSVVWRALLAGSRLHGNVEIAEIALTKVLELDPGHCGSYVLISNAYVAAGRYDEVIDVRDLMRQKNVRKVPGCSWIELKDGVHAFINSDKTHPPSDRIYAELLSLTARLSEQGYVPGT
ncbi:hypothetical protein CDL15_Pgr009876 [Punica granatum]|uniref:Pentatricopeptide repeat-containing protein At3g14730 n=1 Tax=Punica granatum TaxID=22663 RepID=A0A218WV46_PUNGR|nr:hypothetical protein CDL15_Pgr009876 [Punica granatum]